VIKDFPFGRQVRCTTTPGPEGADCNLETTLDALLPNFVKEGKRTMIAARDVILRDAGADGRVPQQGCPPACGSGDERAFLRKSVRSVSFSRAFDTGRGRSREGRPDARRISGRGFEDREAALKAAAPAGEKRDRGREARGRLRSYR